MGQLHWDRHAKKPEPLKTQDLGDNLLLVVRERKPDNVSRCRFVATVRYKSPPVPGKFVKTYAYGSTPDRAEVAALYYLEEINGGLVRNA